MDHVQHALAERVLRDMYDAVVVLDIEGIVYANGPAARMLEIQEGYQKTDARTSVLTDNAYNKSFNEAILSALYNKETTTVRKVPYMSPSGKKYVFILSSSMLQDAESVQLVITLSDETVADQMTQKFKDASNTFTTFLFGFCAWILFYAFWEFRGRPFSADIMTHGVELLGLIMLVFIVYSTSLTRRDLGIIPSEMKKSIRTALIIAGCLIVLMIGFKLVCRLLDPNCFEPDAPFIDFRRFGVRQLLYIFTAGIQEFLARIAVQRNIKRIAAGKHGGFRAIILSSLIFAALHIHHGFIFMAGSAILAGLEGILYEKQQNLFSVWLVHWVFGVCATLLCLIDH